MMIMSTSDTVSLVTGAGEAALGVCTENISVASISTSRTLSVRVESINVTIKRFISLGAGSP